MKEEAPAPDPPQFLIDVVAASTGALLSTCVGYPLETVKFRQQMAAGPAATASSWRETLRSI